MSFIMVRKDITRLQVDAIVNAANTSLLEGSGVCGAIFRAAGSQQLKEACQKLAPIQTGEAVLTPGFDLPATYIIHTAGPVYSKKNQKESERLLRAAYQNSLQLAVSHKLNSLAFPLISSGIYGYPPDQALMVAVSEIRAFLEKHELDVVLTILNQAALKLSRQTDQAIKRYLKDNYRAPKIDTRRQSKLGLSVKVEEERLAEPVPDLFIRLEETFAQLLLRLIDKSGQTDVEVYKRANLNRRLFSKIRSNKDYLPSKRTALALAVALQLDLDQTGVLLGRAGYALSPAVKSDLIVEYFISQGSYDIFAINEALFAHGQPLLGGVLPH